MTGKISLILGSHAHLSSAAEDEEFEELYRAKLKPFIITLNQYPKIPAVVHYSGPLLNRLEQKKPELFLLIKELVARKQLEVLGGGFYEPALSLLPSPSRIDQIELFTTYLRQNFGRKPQGCWLARGYWEQSLVGVLSTCGMAYTFLSEERFAAAGRAGEALYSPALTEDQGKLVVVFPVFTSFKTTAFSALRNAVLSKPGPAADHGPGQAAKVVTVFPEFPQEKPEEEGRAFFADLASALADKSKEAVPMEATTPGKVYKTCGALPRVYFPPSYGQPRAQPRDFLIRYPEANNLYSKMYYIHSLIYQLRGDKSRKQTAKEELWKAQGVETFSLDGGRGLSSFPIRAYSYRAILAAERITREKDFKPSLLSFDFDLDRTAEYLFQDKNSNFYVRSRGAVIFELDHILKGWNYLNTFSGGSYRRCAFMDRLLPGDYIPGGPYSFPENSRFCGEEEYSVSNLDRQKLKSTFTLPPKKDIPFGFIEIQKTYKLEKNTLQLSYVLRNRGDEKTILCFVPQFDLSLADEEARLLFRKSQGEEEPRGVKTPGEVRRFSAMEEQDPKQSASMTISLQMPCDLYYYPIWREDGGYQSTCFLPVFQLFLNPGNEWENKFTLSLSSKTQSRKQELSPG
ncbi:MAG: DUF1926 domain-containing protein [Treponema sp.]|jgi:hypothetical protein|nr:DUF1926 domain-containing protein [Treponema sp.]